MLKLCWNMKTGTKSFFFLFFFLSNVADGTSNISKVSLFYNLSNLLKLIWKQKLLMFSIWKRRYAHLDKASFYLGSFISLWTSLSPTEVRPFTSVPPASLSKASCLIIWNYENTSYFWLANSFRQHRDIVKQFKSTKLIFINSPSRPGVSHKILSSRIREWTVELMECFWLIR